MKLKLALKDSMIALILATLTNATYAQAAFASTASSMMNNILTGLMIIFGVVAAIALAWQIAEGVMQRKTWPEVFTTCAWILALGAAPALAKWIFGSGQGLTF
ncbi:hypothetical protein [Pelistega sp. MC2]|uniref:hypothetical protein n=1 Tax=Pelistega sp. MC2 TaxID=1720297 RepID=UPI0008DA535F|nr:hypothetical protein [Pelistega sp. MC2]